MNAGPVDDRDENRARITGHKVGISAITQHGARVTLELLLDDPQED